MYSIGEFSRITGLSIKALRLYHEKKLLIPAEVDEFTSYRYYSKSDIDLARMIVYLRNMQFSLSEIKEITENFEDESELVDFLEVKRIEIEQKLENLKAVTFSLDSIISKEKEIKMTLENSEFVIEEKEVDTLLVASIRTKARYEQVGEYFAKIGKAMGRHINGKALTLYHDAEYKEDDADIEPCMPVRKGKDAEGITVKELPGGICVSLIHKGPYDELGRSYSKVLDYIKDKGYKSVLPSREVYLKGPGMILRGNPKNYLTEIQFFIAH